MAPTYREFHGAGDTLISVTVQRLLLDNAPSYLPFMTLNLLVTSVNINLP